MSFRRNLVILFSVFIMCIGIGFITFQPVNAAVSNDYGVTSKKPIKYSKNKSEIYILTKVNGVYLNQSTRHVIVSENGSNADKSLLKTKATPNQFYKDLKKIGAKPGDNLTKKSKNGSKIKGSKLKVSFVVKDKKIVANKAIQVNGKKAKDLKFRFGGNKATAKKKNTGCVVCFDSCPVGIVSGARYGFGYGEHFTGKSNVLPKDGKNMVVVVRLVK